MPHNDTDTISREAYPSSLNLSKGSSLDQVSMDEVVDFLRSRRLEKLRAESATLRIVNSGNSLVLEHVNGQVQQWPLRHTFFQKLLRWYQFPRKPVYRMEIGDVVVLLNAILKLIGREVSVTIEDGDALSIFRAQYRELPDLDILGRCPQTISSVSRTDFFMRAFTETRFKADAVPGDTCGFGTNIFNSETGFMALEVSAFILRFICSNGAVCPLEYSSRHRLIHYNLSLEEVSQYLDQAFVSLNKTLPILAARLQESVKKPLPDEKVVINSLNGILDFPNGKKLYEYYRAQNQSRLYDLFNFVTEQAKRYPAERRLQMEQYAGDLISAG